MPTTGLRYFKVYDPWGRPDMSPWLIIIAILEGRPIDVFNHGRIQRDFTYVDDIAEGTVRTMDRIAATNPVFDSSRPDPGSSRAPCRAYNIGNHQTVELMSFIGTIEKALGKEARKSFLPMHAGVVPSTCADVDDLRNDVGFAPKTPLDQGIARWVDWFREYTHRAAA